MNSQNKSQKKEPSYQIIKILPNNDEVILNNTFSEVLEIKDLQTALNIIDMLVKFNEEVNGNLKYKLKKIN